MKDPIIIYIITFLIGVTLTNIINKLVKAYKSEKAERNALLMILQNNLTNLAFVCTDLGYIMDYQLKGWYNMKGAYKALGGNDYIDALDEKIKALPVRTTDVLQHA